MPNVYTESPESESYRLYMNMGYLSDAARTRTRNLFRHKRSPILRGHSDG